MDLGLPGNRIKSKAKIGGQRKKKAHISEEENGAQLGTLFRTKKKTCKIEPKKNGDSRARTKKMTSENFTTEVFRTQRR